MQFILRGRTNTDGEQEDISLEPRDICSRIFKPNAWTRHGDGVDSLEMRRRWICSTNTTPIAYSKDAKVKNDTAREKCNSASSDTSDKGALGFAGNQS